MATFNLTGYARDRLGNAIVGAAAQAYLVNNDGSHGIATGASVTVDASTGKWTVPIDTSTQVSPSGLFAVKVTAGSDVRWVEPFSTIMISGLIGVNGAAPLANNTVSDAIIGNRTVVQGNTMSGDAGVLSSILSALGHGLQMVMHGDTVTGHWYDGPATNLTATAAHLADVTGNPHHVSTTQIGAVAKGTGGATTMRGGLDGSKPSSSLAVGDLYVSSDSPRKLYRALDSSSWHLVASMDYNDLLNKPTGGVVPHHHPGTDIDSTVSSASTATTATNATSLAGSVGKVYPALSGTTGAATGSFVLGTDQLKIQSGHVDVTTDGSGDGSFLLASPVTGTLHVALSAAGGSSPGVTVQPRNYPSAGGQTQQIHAAGAGSTSVSLFLTYLHIGW